MKAAKDRKEEFFDPTRKDNILERNITRLELWEEHLKDPIVALDKALSAWKISTEAGSRHIGSKAAMACDRVVSDLMLPLWEEVLWPFLDAWDSVRLRTTSQQWNVPRRYGPYGELFFLLVKELSRLLPSIRPHGELLLLLMQQGLQPLHRGSVLGVA